MTDLCAALGEPAEVRRAISEEQDQAYLFVNKNDRLPKKPLAQQWVII